MGKKQNKNINAILEPLNKLHEDSVFALGEIYVRLCNIPKKYTSDGLVITDEEAEERCNKLRDMVGDTVVAITNTIKSLSETISEELGSIDDGS